MSSQADNYVTGFSTTSGDLLGAMQRAIARQETGFLDLKGVDPYKAQGPATKYGYATGRYQFLDSTWRGLGGSTARAKDATPAEQDRIARTYMSRLLARFHGDPQLVAIAWHAGEGAAAQVAAGQRSAASFRDPAAHTNSGAYSTNVARWVRESLAGGGGVVPPTPTGKAAPPASSSGGGGGGGVLGGVSRAAGQIASTAGDLITAPFSLARRGVDGVASGVARSATRAGVALIGVTSAAALIGGGLFVATRPDQKAGAILDKAGAVGAVA